MTVTERNVNGLWKTRLGCPLDCSIEVSSNWESTPIISCCLYRDDSEHKDLTRLLMETTSEPLSHQVARDLDGEKGEGMKL